VRPSGNQTPQTRRIDWIGILRILLVEVLVLLALSAAVIRYLDWSSEQALEEFSRAGIPPAPAAKSPPPSSTPVQDVDGRAKCPRRV
jgi:hypothetical protein